MLNKILKYGCMELAYKNRQFLSQKPILYNLFWETTLRCNARCKHCGSRAGENSNIVDNELSTNEIKKVFSDIAQKYDPRKILVSVTGGEPLIRNDVFEVMQYANSLGFKWGMTTNGMLINDNVISNMKSSGMSTISISLDGLEETHNEFRQVHNGYNQVIDAVKKLKEANFLNVLQITTVITKSSINELDKLYEIISDLNITSWRIVNMDPIGRALDNANILLSKEEYIKLFDFIKSKRKKAKFDITYGCSHFLGFDYEQEVRQNPFFCASGYTTASILYNGDIYVCPNVERKKELIQGNVKQDNFVDIWENGFKWFRDDNNRSCNKCKNCEDWKYCKGDALHTWDFEKNEPKICFKEILK